MGPRPRADSFSSRISHTHNSDIDIAVEPPSPRADSASPAESHADESDLVRDLPVRNHEPQERHSDVPPLDDGSRLQSVDGRWPEASHPSARPSHGSPAERQERLGDTSDSPPDVPMRPEAVDTHGNPVAIPNRALRGTYNTTPPVFTADRPNPQHDARVDATNIRGAFRTPQNPAGAIYHRSDDRLLARYETRGPNEIFGSGFAPRRLRNTDLTSLEYDHPSAFVSTTRDPNLNYRVPAASFGDPTYRYIIDARGGIDLGPTMGRSGEVVFAGGIRTQNIVGVQEIRRRPVGSGGADDDAPENFEFGDFIPNPHYQPSAPNPDHPTSHSSSEFPGQDRTHGIPHAGPDDDALAPPHPTDDTGARDSPDREIDESSPTIRADIDAVRHWLPEINPGMADDSERRRNCTYSTIAVFDRLSAREGFGAAPVGLEPLNVYEIESATGLTAVNMPLDKIRDRLRAQDDETHTVVGVMRERNGHAFNVLNHDGRLVIFDGQQGRSYGWPPDGYDAPGNAVTGWYVYLPDAQAEVIREFGFIRPDGSVGPRREQAAYAGLSFLGVGFGRCIGSGVGAGGFGCVSALPGGVGSGCWSCSFGFGCDVTSVVGPFGLGRGVACGVGVARFGRCIGSGVGAGGFGCVSALPGGVGSGCWSCSFGFGCDVTSVVGPFGLGRGVASGVCAGGFGCASTLPGGVGLGCWSCSSGFGRASSGIGY